MKYLIIALALFLPMASAELVFQQVYYDPVGTESGGEAIELFNRGSESVDLSGWTIGTASSARDVVFAEGTRLAGMKSILIADEGWDDKKDSAAWRSADIVQTMTLGNGASFVELKDANNQTKDVLGWGEDTEKSKGSPATLVKAGESLMRISSTGDNAEDFIAVKADFQAGILVPLTADVQVFVPVIEVSEALTLAPEGTFVVKNNGDSDITITLSLGDLSGREGTISKDSLEIEGGTSFTVAKGAEYRAKVRVKTSKETIPGRYQGAIRVIIQ